jgi:hypothetical protein
MGIEVTRIERYVSNYDRRMAFHFGNVVASEGPHQFLELTLAVDGEPAEGLSMSGMTPMWFLKDPDLSPTEATEALRDVAAAACENALALDPTPTVFDLWHDLFERQRAWAADTPHPPLLWAYGVSMVEQAVIDAFCRHRDTAFGDAVREDAFGIEPGRIYDELAGASPADYLPETPTREAAVRHTVGLTDPLRPEVVDEADRLDDGLPQSLLEYVDRQGVDHFKIKLSADEERDAERLARIGGALEASGLSSYRCTLDANEQYDSVGAFKEQWERLTQDPSVASVVDHVLYVEQPLPRSEALTEETGEVLRGWDERPPMIIDESDDLLDSAGRALECGYAGTSHKNCKGVFKGVVNACLIEKRRREDGGEYVMSGEDLTTIGPVELLQDLAVMGTLDMDHIERNGHHYYRGLSFLPDDLQDRVVAAHGDLYRRHEDGFAAMEIEDGRFRFESAIDAPFGRDFELAPSGSTPIEQWDVESTYE